MGDSWDDDEYEPPALSGAVAAAPTSWEDEDEVESEAPLQHGSKPQLSAAKAERLAKEAAAAKQARLREQRMIEEGDNALAEELFSGVTADAAATVAADPDAVTINLKDLKDHLQLVETLCDKMSGSKQNHVSAFAKAFLKANEERWEIAELSDMIATLTKFKTDKEAKLKKPTLGKKEVTKKKTKKEIVAEKKKHNDLFGDNDCHGEYDKYEDQFDDFF